MTDDLTLRVLTAAAAADAQDTLWWRVDGSYAPITFFVNCSDFFDNAADLEPITADNIAAYEKAFADAREVTGDGTGGDPTFGPLLFVARWRRQRPQAGAYPPDRRLWPLLDAAGPERATADSPHLPEEVRDELWFPLHGHPDGAWHSHQANGAARHADHSHLDAVPVNQAQADWRAAEPSMPAPAGWVEESVHD